MSDPTVSAPSRVTLTNIDIPFTRLVAFFVKASLAAIPAAIILFLIFAVAGLVLGAIFGGGPMMRYRSWTY